MIPQFLNHGQQTLVATIPVDSYVKNAVEACELIAVLPIVNRLSQRRRIFLDACQVLRSHVLRRQFSCQSLQGRTNLNSSAPAKSGVAMAPTWGRMLASPLPARAMMASQTGISLVPSSAASCMTFSRAPRAVLTVENLLH
jgi:hypothetical protein